MTKTSNEPVKASSLTEQSTQVPIVAQEGMVEKPKPNIIMQFVPIIVIFVVFYFLLIRPQQKKSKEHSKLLSSIKANDKVITTSGVFATVTKVYEKESLFQIEISKGVKILIMKSSILRVLEKDKDVAEFAAMSQAKDSQ
jgi:preprotein translocase YajC subunit